MKIMCPLNNYQRMHKETSTGPSNGQPKCETILTKYKTGGLSWLSVMMY